ncbi:MAG: endonuclease/exonuclease/phosphatase family protein [Pseudomonadota bacterium]
MPALIAIAQFFVLPALFWLAVMLIAGFLGALHPALDSFAHFRHHLAAAGLIVALIAVICGRGRWRWTGVPVLILAVFSLWTVWPFLAPHSATPEAARPSGAGPYTLLQMNLLYDAQQRPALDLIDTIDADIVLLQEVSRPWRDAVNTLSESYPHQVYCDRGSTVGGLAILSRHPFGADAMECFGRSVMLRQGVLIDGRPLTVISQHLAWPWPYEQWNDLASIAAALQRAAPNGTASPPVLVAGDFNAVPWSAAVQRYARLAGVRPVHGVGGTWTDLVVPSAMLRWAGLPIDNVLTSPGVRVLSIDTLPPTASDHRPIVMQFSLEQGVVQ